MNRELRSRAETLLLMQECDVVTDRQTLDAAIRIAHHESRFRSIPDKWNQYFKVLAAMMKSKYPSCPCKACRSKQKSA